MKIIDEILNPYQIHNNGNSYDVIEKTERTDKEGEPIFKTHAFCSSMEHALHKIVKLKVDVDKEYNLKSYIYEIKKATKQVTSILNN